jgi:hypothetical protein
VKTAAAMLPLLALLAGSNAASGQATAVAPLAPVVDPENLLPATAKDRMSAALLRFRERTGRWLVVVVAAQRPELQAEDAAPGVGVVLGIGRDNPGPRLLLTDPAWLKGAPEGYADAVAGVLETRFRYKDFVERTVLSTTLLARVLPDKLAFMERPARRLSPGSITFSQWAMGVFGLLIVFGYGVIVYRDMFSSRAEPVGDELRRLRAERRRW